MSLEDRVVVAVIQMERKSVVIAVVTVALDMKWILIGHVSIIHVVVITVVHVVSIVVWTVAVTN